MRSGARMLLRALPRRLRRTSSSGSPDVSQLGVDERARKQRRQRRARRARPIRARAAGRRRRAATRSRRGRGRRRSSASAISTTSSRIEAVLELGDHRRRRVAGGALPDAALDRRDEVEDPGADRDAERQDRGRRRMLGDRRGRRPRARSSGRRSAGGRATTVASSGAIDAAAVAAPQDDRERAARATRSASRRAARAPWRDMRASAGIGCCSSSFSAPLCRSPATSRIADERQQERGRQLARAERRRPDADQRRERFADAGRGAVQPAQLGVGPHGADERDADERPDQQQHHPPRARRQQLAPFLLEQPRERRSYVSARNTSSRSTRRPIAPRGRRRAVSSSSVPSPQTRPPLSRTNRSQTRAASLI